MRKILQTTVFGEREEQPMTSRVLAVKYPPSQAALRPPEALETECRSMKIHIQRHRRQWTLCFVAESLGFS